MGEQIITDEDLQYLASESSNSLNLILVGMTFLMEENDDMVSMLEKQNWFQRMSMTISGKNKMTQQDISRNHSFGNQPKQKRSKPLLAVGRYDACYYG